jgi:hypothetical protein
MVVWSAIANRAHLRAWNTQCDIETLNGCFADTFNDIGTAAFLWLVVLVPQ